MKNSQKGITFKHVNKSLHCAFLKTKDNKILATAYNDEDNHAEINVINKAKKLYKNKVLKKLCLESGGFILEVVRITKHGYALSKPCHNCMKRIDICSGIVLVNYS